MCTPISDELSTIVDPSRSFRSSPVYTLAHVSDLHLSSLKGVRAYELLGKRVLGYLSWLQHRRIEHCGKVLQALVQDLGVTRPDHIVVTGDLTHLGLPMEFREVMEWLKRVAAPVQLTVVPGNHEAYARTSRHSLALWVAYMISDPPFIKPGMTDCNLFPSLRVRGPLALIGLSSACPTGPLLATGTLGSQQLDTLDELLVETGRQGLIRTVLVHHPPVEGTVGWHKRLTDSHALRAVFARRGVELVLHGHAHRACFNQLEMPCGFAPVIGVPSGSAIGVRSKHRAQYHLYCFSPNKSGWELHVSVRGYIPALKSFAPEGERRLSIPGG
jgi:predicted phosphodiesterase